MSVRVTLSKEGYSTYFMAIQSRWTFLGENGSFGDFGDSAIKGQNQNSARAKTNISLALLQLALSLFDPHKLLSLPF